MCASTHACVDAWLARPCAALPCTGAALLRRFLEVLGGTRGTLDICVFTITCDEIANTVIDLHKRNVKVRIITDNDQVRGEVRCGAASMQASIQPGLGPGGLCSPAVQAFAHLVPIV